MKIYNDIDYSDIFDLGYSTATYDNHSMGKSLKKYIEIKISNILLSNQISNIIVVGNYDRTQGILEKEKNDKLFNFKRPTITVDNDTAIVNCYPGIDYVYHYASLIKTYLQLLNCDKNVNVLFPTQEDIQREIEKSNLKNVPMCKTAILGYVVGFDYLSSDTRWNGDGDFQWKNINDDKILIGCKHSYWGDISGHVVSYLAHMGFERIIYIGKLGTLNDYYIPNETIATGSKSVFLDGSDIQWNNIFEQFNSPEIKDGIHYTLPSIIQETNDWVIKNKEKVDFVDPEIGHMAKSAKNNNIEFSYMHIISDNLVQKYPEDLSNERKQEILVKRKRLIKVIGNCISQI